MSLVVDVAGVEFPATTTYDDLMDLGSRWSYDRDLGPAETGVAIEKTQVIVNGKRFVVLDRETDPLTGLDALLFENDVTGELVVGFVGSEDRTDMWMDAQLISESTVPAQFSAARRYVEEVEAQFGRPVSQVCGNSLGGGLAAYVALGRPDILAVTVNPAPVPGPALENRSGTVDNVVNFVSRQDPLNRALIGAGLEDRVVGETLPFPGTSDNVLALATNHIGSDRGDPAGTPYDASMAVPFSLVHADTVVASGSFGSAVDIDVSNLTLMAEGLDRLHDDVGAVCRAHLTGAEGELRQYAGDAPRREAHSRERFVAMVRESTALARVLLSELEEVIDRYVQRPLNDLPQPPFLLRPAWAAIRAVTSPWDDVVRIVRELCSFTTTVAATAAWDAARASFVAESQTLTYLLADQCGQLARDQRVVDGKWTAFTAALRSVSEAVAQVDETTAAAIAARRCPRDALDVAVVPCPAGQVEPLQEHIAKQFTQVVVDTRQQACGVALGVLAGELAEVVGVSALANATLVSAGLEALGQAFRGHRTAMRSATTVLGVSAPGVALRVAGAWDDIDRFSAKLDACVRDIERGIDQAQDVIDDLRRALQKLPDVVDQFAPELQESFFSDGMIERTYDALLRCRNVVDRSELAFQEVEFQLDDHDARMIDALAGRAADVRVDLATVVTSLTTMVS